MVNSSLLIVLSMLVVDWCLLRVGSIIVSVCVLLMIVVMYLLLIVCDVWVLIWVRLVVMLMRGFFFMMLISNL